MLNRKNIAVAFIVVAAILIVYGRVNRENLVAAAGYALLALTALAYFLTR